MRDRSADGRKARALRSCRAALESCDDITLRRLECMLATIAHGARLERYLLSAPASQPLPAEAERLIALLDPAHGVA